MPTALVTGGTRGIGEAVAKKLKKSGYNVVINYFSSKARAEELEKQGFFTVRADVADDCQVKEMFDAVKKRFGKVDVLINNAGIALKQKTFFDVDEAEFDRVFAVDVKGVFLCSKYAALNMLRSGGGDIINVSSVFGVEGASCEAVYSAAKGAVIAFTKSLAKELEGASVRVQAVAPSMVDTDMNAHLSTKDKASYLADRGQKEMLTAEDVADVVARLLKEPENGSVTVIESRDNAFKSA